MTRKQTLSVQAERRLTKTDAAARWLNGEVRDCGGYVLVSRRGRVWTISKKTSGWQKAAKDLLA